MREIAYFFENAVEIEKFGFNTTTIVSLITVASSVYTMWGVTQQLFTINQKKSAESISIPLIIYEFFYYIVTIIYGWYVKELSVIINGLNVFFFLIVLIAILRYERIKFFEIMVFLVLSLMIPVMLFIQNKQMAYLGCSSVVIPSAISQFVILILKKKRGSLEPKLVKVYIITSSVWLLYGIIANDWVFKLSGFASLLILVPIAILLKKYKDN
jgi:hypothetical protein